VYTDPQLTHTLFKISLRAVRNETNQFGNGTLELAEILNSNAWKSNNSKALGGPQ
jgi:hypothetical protein